MHIGAPKTGSTSIQHTLAANQKLLIEKGYFFPSFEKNHRFLTSCFIDNPEHFDYNRYAGITEKDGITINNEANKRLLEDQFNASGCSSLILSSEHLVLLSEAGIARLREYLLTLVMQVRVIVYLRHPADSVGSFIQEATKNGDNCIANLAKNPPHTRIKALLERWAKFFGHDCITARDSQGTTLLNDNLVDDFLDIIDFPIRECSISRIRSNLSLSQFAVEIADRLAILYPKFSEKRAPQRHITRMLSSIPGPKYRPASSVVRAVIESTQQDLAYLKNVWSLELTAKCAQLSEGDPKQTVDNQTLDILAEIVNTAANNPEITAKGRH